MDFVSVTTFLILSYLRPQEWIQLVEMLKPVKICVAMAVISMVMRYRGFSPKDFFRTPHDWWMFAFVGWVIISAPDIKDTFDRAYSFILFYVVTVQAISTTRRCQIFLNWWTVMIVAIAGLAVAAEYGFDVTGASYDLTHNKFQNRLSLSTSIYANPNALGHAVYPGLLMIYFTLFWKRPIFSKIAAIPFVALVLLCIYLTLSKGAFLCCFVTAVFTFSFGRPKIVQIIILIFSLTVGWAAMQTLPRMSELDRTKTDGAIQGRIAASKFGYSTMKSTWAGIGYGNFNEAFVRANHYQKAAHSSYVEYGAETGKIGFFLFWGVIYCCLRTLMQMKTRDTIEERIRRTLFAFLCAYLISSWMVDFGFRAVFFLCCATIAAYHRLMLNEPPPLPRNTLRTSDSTSDQILPPSFLRQIPASAPQSANERKTSDNSDSIPLYGTDFGIKWNKMHWYDYLMVLMMTYGAIRFWEYLFTHM